jgi:carboxylate-amine ligase
VLTALSAGSPFWQGVDSGYASFRSQLWRRWPSAGSPGPFGSPAAYHALVAELVATETIVDDGMAYFDVRLSRDYPTLEVRVADVCPRVEVSAAVAVLARALVERAAADWAAGVPAPDLSPATASLMTFRAARSGLSGALVDPVSRTPRPAATVVAALLEHVAEPLAAYGDRALVDEVVGSLLTDGTAAERHRRVAGDDLDLAAVVRDTVELTHAVR